MGFSAQLSDELTFELPSPALSIKTVGRPPRHPVPSYAEDSAFPIRSVTLGPFPKTSPSDQRSRDRPHL